MRQKIAIVGLLLGLCVTFGACDSASEIRSAQIQGPDVKDEAVASAKTTKIDVSEGGVYKITGSGSYEISGSSENAAILVDGEDIEVELILCGVNIKNPTGPCILGNKSKKITIKLKEGTENTLEDGSTYETSSDGEEVGKAVIFSNDDIKITGEGTLNITAHYKHGICSDDNITIKAGNINIISAATDAIHANDVITIDGGTLTLNANSDLIQAGVTVYVNGGSISGESKDEGIEGKESVYVTGGTINVDVSDDGINAGNLIQIDDGTIYVTTTRGDAIDSNGSIIINGGLVNVRGGSAPEGGLDCDNESVFINGGIVIATGAINSPIADTSAQVSVVYGSFTGGVALGILDEAGNTVFAMNPQESDTTMIISVPGLETGKTYKVMTGGSITGTEDAYGYVKDGTYSGGEEALSFTVEGSVVQAGGSASGMGGMGGMGGFNKGDFKKGNFNRENLDNNSSDSNAAQGSGTDQRPEGFDPSQGTNQMPEGFDPSQMPEGFDPNSNQMPEGFDPSQKPEGFGPGQNGNAPGNKTNNNNL